MTERGDEVLREVAALPDPALPAARGRQIQALARARFLAGASAPAAPRRLRARGLEVAATALLTACIVAYLAWTAVMVASLQGSAQRPPFQRAAAGAGR